jgi:IS5 family transposase
MLGAQEKLKGNKIIELNKLINWNRCMNHLKKIHKQDESLMGGQVAYDRLKMFKAILLQQWHSLSDMELVEALKERISFMAFTGFELADEIPDASTFCRFRNKLIERNLDERLFREVNSQIEKIGLKLEKAQCAIVDATIVESCNRPRRTTIIENDREEQEIKIEQEESKDADARWLKKGNRFFFGYKSFATVDEDGYYEKIHTTPANLAEVNQFKETIKGSKAKRVLADKGYASKKNREIAKENGLKDGIMYKAQVNKPLTNREKLINKLISKRRYVVERAFGTLKKHFGFTRASYAGVRKVQAQITLKAICANLLKAVNRAIEWHFVPNCV